MGAYLGLTPGRRQSGASDPQMHITKEGDPYLRQLLVQGAADGAAGEVLPQVGGQPIEALQGKQPMMDRISQSWNIMKLGRLNSFQLKATWTDPTA